MSRGMTRREVLGSGAAAAALSFTPSPAIAAPAMLAASAMQSDVVLLRAAYEALHPGLLRYVTPGILDERFDGLANSVRRPLTLPSFYLALSQFLATIRCGHSYANFYNQSKKVQAALFEAADRLPLAFVWLGPRMVVTADPFGTGITPGSEIISIEGRLAGAVLAGLLTVARADGGNDAKRRQLMSMQGDNAWESFDIFYPLLFGRRSSYRLVVADPVGRRRTAQVAAVSLAERRSQKPKRPSSSSNDPIWTMETRGETAVLTMPSWALYNSKWDWRGWITEQVDALVAKETKRLVIDIRANEGGLDCGNLLAARLIEQPVPRDTARRLVRYRRVPDDLRPFLETWDRSFDDWGERARPFDDRFLELVGDREDEQVITPNGPRYTGQVTVLIGPQNSSATFGFAQLVRRERLATLVGETTGGNRRGINGGSFYFLRLPETGIEVDLPLVGSFPKTVEPDAGINPDRMITLSPADIAAGRDAVLAETS